MKTQEQQEKIQKRIDEIDLKLWREFRERMEDNEIMHRILKDEFDRFDRESLEMLESGMSYTYELKNGKKVTTIGPATEEYLAMAKAKEGNERL